MKLISNPEDSTLWPEVGANFILINGNLSCFNWMINASQAIISSSIVWLMKIVSKVGPSPSRK